MNGSYVDISMTTGGHMAAYLASGPGTDRRPGLVILQEIFGITENLRQTADAFAATGFDVIVPDLFWRQQERVELDPGTEEGRASAVAFMKGLDQPQAIEDALQATAYLRKGDTSSGTIGAVGYCLGGKLAYLLASRAGIDAAVSYYGVAIESVLDQAGRLKAPLLLHVGKEDSLCPPPAQAAIHEALGSRVNVEIIDYPGVGHAFARRASPAYNAEAAGRADASTTAFLRHHLVIKRKLGHV